MRNRWILATLGTVAVAVAYLGSRATADVTPRSGDAHLRPESRPEPKRGTCLPLVFEANRGQAPEGFDFLVRCRGYHAFVAPKHVVFSFDGAPLTMSMDGAAPREPETRGLELPGKSNYLLGNDPSKWVTNVPQFRGARYPDVVRGASWSFGGNGRALEFAFDLAPGAASPRLRLDGHSDVRVATDGKLRVEMPHGVATMSAPVAWQEIDGDERDVAAAWALGADGSVCVALGAHDMERAVHVDPTVNYETYFGGSGTDDAEDVAMDASGAAYISGFTNSADFPTSTMPLDGTRGGTLDGFVTKLTPAGTSLVYSTYIGGSANEHFNGIAVNSAGEAYVCGDTASSDYPSTPGAYNTTKSAGDQAVATKLSAAGDGLVWSTFLNGFATSVISPCLGAGGALHVGTQSGAAVCAIAADGSSLPWQRQVGALTQDLVRALCTDAVGNVYVVGYTSGGGFPATVGAYDETASGQDAFLTKLDPNGVVVFATYLGGTGSDFAWGVGVNLAQQAYVVGETQSTNFPVTADAYQPTTNSLQSFLTRFSASGTTLRYSTYFRSTTGSAIQLRGISVHPTGSCVVIGTTSTNGCPVTNAWQPTFGGQLDGIGAKFERTGTLAWSSYIGGAGSDSGFAVGMAPNGTVILTGDVASPNLPTVSPYQSTVLGAKDAFLVKVEDSLVTDLTAPTIVTTTLPQSTAGVAYSQAMASSSGLAPFKWTLASGALPVGLTVSSAGIVSGTPTQVGDFVATVHLEDSCDLAAPNRDLTLHINPAPAITASVIPVWTRDRPFDWQIPATGGTSTLVFTLVSGNLPAGMDTNGVGRVFGTPAADGDFNLTVKVTDAVGATATRALTWHVAAPPEIVAGTLPEWTEARPYGRNFASTGGSGATTWSVAAGVLPVYTDIDPATGAMFGTTRAAGDYAFTLEVHDGAGASAQRAFTMKLNAFPEIVNAKPPLAIAGRPYSLALLGTGGTPPVTWALDTTIPGSSLPQGLSFSGAVVSGTPARGDLRRPTFTYSDAHGAVGRRILVLEVAGALDLVTRKTSEPISLAADEPGSPSRWMEVLEGTTITAGLKAKGKDVFGAAQLTLSGPDGTAIDVTAYLKSKPKSVTLKNVPVPTTGRYVLTVVRAGDSAADATLAVSIAPKTSWPGGGAVTNSGAPTEFAFSAPPGATVAISAKSAKGSAALPHIVSVLDEHGVDVAAGVVPKEKAKAASLKLATALTGGRYRVLFAARDANAGDIAWTVALKLPKTYDFALPDLGAGDGL